MNSYDNSLNFFCFELRGIALTKERQLDAYTHELKDWLNKRFSSCDENGVYIAHQPIYGFRKSPCEPGHISRYIITYRLLEALNYLEFDSLLDVGGAEGYKAFLANKLFGIPVHDHMTGYFITA